MWRWVIACVWLGIASSAWAQPEGWVTTMAGTGPPDSTGSPRQIGDGGPARMAQLVNPFDAVSDGQGNVFILDTSQQRVRKVDAQGVIVTVAGTGRYGFSDGGGRASEASFADPMGLALDASGNLYVADTFNHRVRVVDAVGGIRTVAGTGERGYGGDGGPAIEAQVYNPSGLALGPDGAIYVADQGNHRVRRIDPSGIIHTVAGTGDRGFWGDGGPAIEAQLSDPSGVALGPDGAIYIADWGNHRVRRIDPSGMIHTVAGAGEWGYGGDGGLAIEAQLLIPSRVAVDALGQVYVVDRGNSRIRRVDTDGHIVSVLAAKGWNRPFGLSVDPQGRLWVADTENHLVRVVERPARVASLVRDREAIAGDGQDASRLLLSLSDGATGVQAQFRVLSGQGALSVAEGKTSGGLAGAQFVSQWPGRAVVEVRVAGALPVSAEVDVQPVRALEVTVDRARIAANGEDVARIQAVVRDANGAGEVASAVVFEMVAGEGMLEVENGVAQVRARASGLISVEARTPGAFPALVSVFAQAPLPHQIADVYEPDNTPDQAVLLGSEPQARTFHTPGDVDWIAVPVRPGYAVQLIAEGDAPVRAAIADEAFDLPGDLFPPEAGGEDAVRVALSHGAGGVGAYVLRAVERRTAQLSLQASALVADGEEVVDVVVQVLDRFGVRDVGDDTTQVHFAVVEGPGEMLEAAIGVREGEGRARLRSAQPGRAVVEARAQGVPPARVGVDVLPALMVRADPIPGEGVRVALVAGAGVKGATGVQVRLQYDGEGLIFNSFEPAGLLSGAEPIVVVGDGVLEINAVLLDGQIAEDGGLLGRIRFHAASAEPRSVALVAGQYGSPSGIFPFGIGGITGQVQVRADTFEQWVHFQEAFGAVKGDIRYQAIWDIDGDGAIGFGDFLKWLGH